MGGRHLLPGFLLTLEGTRYRPYPVRRCFLTLHEQFLARLARAFRRLLRGSADCSVLAAPHISTHGHIRALLLAMSASRTRPR